MEAPRSGLVYSGRLKYIYYAKSPGVRERSKEMGAGASLPSRKRKQTRLPKYADVVDDYIGPRQFVLGEVCFAICVLCSMYKLAIVRCSQGTWNYMEQYVLHAHLQRNVHAIF
jgi:hypothetical protein